LPVSFEQLPHFVFGCVEIQISYEDILQATCPRNLSYLSVGRLRLTEAGLPGSFDAKVDEQSNAARSIAGI
jgi:hypothetical protein